jgi:MOSC domain-containing protein YiiM
VSDPISGRVVSVSLSASHSFSKAAAASIRLLAGLGVKGDAHCGALVKHRYRARQDPTQPNLCQVHLLPAELFEELATKGFHVAPGEMGENITTAGIDLLGLPAGAMLTIGETAVVEVTGLREPCSQINELQAGLMKEMIAKTSSGRVLRKAGIMGIVIAGGVVCPGDAIRVGLPEQPWREMVCV